MGLLDQLKSVLGLGSSGEPARSQARDRRGAETPPETASEDAVKGTDTADPGASAGGNDADADAEHDETAGESTEKIKGIGPTYSQRLASAGVESIADLAAADPDALADETGISETRISNWVQRARNR
jgi:predicted flap endonuclease-1-like 5' DNA nuclease